MERSEALSKPKKRKSSSRPLTDEELEAVTYPADVSKEDECDPFSSDDTVVDENYDPNNDESGDSSSSDEDNNSPSVGCQVEAKLVHGPNNSDDEWTDAEEDPEAFPFLSKDDINISIPFDATPLQRNEKVLCVLSGNIHFPTLLKQWRKHPRNRFTDILRILRFVDHSTAKTEDRLFKIRPILEKVVENIKSVYSPGQHLSIDEAMILWRGRLSFPQYIPNKRHKYGIKLYELTTDNGYILNIIIYVGKGTLENQNDSHAASVITTRICQELTEQIRRCHITRVPEEL
nr:unnamed protein product [Callosobruchus analis]